jgi:hypothetical protein
LRRHLQNLKTGWRKTQVLLLTSFLMDALNSISLGSIKRSLSALRRWKALKDAFPSLLSMSSLSLSLSESSSSIPNRSVSHLDQLPTWEIQNRIEKRLNLQWNKVVNEHGSYMF